MNKKSIIFLTIFSVALVFNVGIYAQATNCSDLTDEQIAEAISDRIGDKYPDLKESISVSVENGRAMLGGYAPTKRIRKDIKKIAKKYRKETKCVRKVKSSVKVGVDCSKLTDKEIVKAIYMKLLEKYPDLDHMALTLEDGTLTIHGWVANKKQRKNIEKIIKRYMKDTKCIKVIVNNLTIGISGGCSGKQIECNGVCIPQNQICHEVPTGN